MNNQPILDEISELRKLINDTNQLNVALYKKLELVDKRMDNLENKKVRKVKETRVPTAYNIFMKETMFELKVTHPQLSNIERMKMAVEAWEVNSLV